MQGATKRARATTTTAGMTTSTARTVAGPMTKAGLAAPGPITTGATARVTTAGVASWETERRGANDNYGSNDGGAEAGKSNSRQRQRPPTVGLQSLQSLIQMRAHKFGFCDA